MLEARGTIGYIAPEVFSRYFGEVSHKSDVYSYGMMILELVGCKNNLDAGDGNSSEIYFPYWVYRRVEEGKEFKLPGVVTSAENEIAKKMIMVGLWCIQARPSDRPPMNKVIEMLQLSIEDLQIPPKPFLSSPPRLDIYSSTSSLS
ncbi:Receptor-like protein kinase [Melia azedarach]|uniref:Receptor-like protein kinase n=1 Tax=Melia azedarach TaxID=155640 RepID=A0ACC1XQ28_MELAZ|nr:Receptor-like protein kinase [Melia azedarach]